MIRIPEDISTRDLHQWVGGGVCLLDETIPVQLMDCEEDEELNFARIDNGRSEYLQMEDVGDRLSAFWPKCGSLNLPGGFAVYVERNQSQQYRRTYNQRVLTLTVPGKWDVMRACGTDRLLSISPNNKDVILAAFNPDYPEWDEAMELLEREDVYSVALNPYVIIGLRGGDPVVFYRGQRAGYIRSGRYVSNGYGLSDARIFKLLQGRVML